MIIISFEVFKYFPDMTQTISNKPDQAIACRQIGVGIHIGGGNSFGAVGTHCEALAELRGRKFFNFFYLTHIFSCKKMSTSSSGTSIFHLMKCLLVLLRPAFLSHKMFSSSSDTTFFHLIEYLLDVRRPAFFIS